MLDPVPWLVGGGAEHSPSVVRTAAYIAANGASGVVNPDDLAVTELPIPGTSVRVAGGAFSIENTYPGQVNQSYQSRNIDYEDVAIPATAGVARSDMIVIRIDDPEFGGTTPADPKVGPYNRFAVLSNVGAGATEIPASVEYPAEALARIDIPASTATITNAMITDLRRLIAPKSLTSLNVGSDVGVSLTSTSATGQSWPKASGWDVKIPAWATHVIALASATGFKTSGNAYGNTWVRMGSTAEPLAVIVGNSGFNSANAPGDMRLGVAPAGKMVIPATLRGTIVNFSIRGKLTDANSTHPLADAWTSASLTLMFVQEPV